MEKCNGTRPYFKTRDILNKISKEAFDACTPNYTNKGIGRVIVFGTGDDMRDEEYVNTFFTPTGIKIVNKSTSFLNHSI